MKCTNKNAAPEFPRRRFHFGTVLSLFALGDVAEKLEHIAAQRQAVGAKLRHGLRHAHARIVRIAAIGTAFAIAGSLAAYAAITVFRQDAYSPYIGLRRGEA